MTVTSTQKYVRSSYFMFPGTVGTDKLPRYQILNMVKIEVCNAYNVTMKDIRSRIGRRTHVEPRHLIVYLLDKLTDGRMTLQEIGNEINRDHASVYCAKRKMRNWMETDVDFKRRVLDIEYKIREE